MGAVEGRSEVSFEIANADLIKAFVEVMTMLDLDSCVKDWCYVL